MFSILGSTRFEQLVEGLDEKTRKKLLEKKIRTKKLKNFCVFCQNNGEFFWKA
jgi:hypothetical protein